MAQRRGRENAVTGGTVRRRSGVDFEKWDGMWLDSDPGAIPPWAFRHLENVEFIGSDIRPRRANFAANASALHDAAACIRSAFDFQSDALRLYLVAKGCPGISTTVGRSILWYDPDFSATIQRMLYYDHATSSAVIAVHDGAIYMGVDAWLKRVYSVQPTVGVEPITITGIQQDTNIVNLAGYKITALRSWEGLLFIAAEDTTTPGASKILVYDGTTILEDLTGIDPVTYICPWRDKLAFGFGSSTNLIKLRSKGAAPGTYANVSPGTGTLGTVSMVEHGGSLYIADGGDDIWDYDGTSLDVFHNVSGATLMNAVESFNGFLYFGYKKVSNSHAILGRWNEGAVFTDEHEDLTATDAALVGIDVLRAYRGDLVAACNISSASSKLYRSAGIDTGATWTLIQSYTPVIYDMLVA